MKASKDSRIKGRDEEVQLDFVLNNEYEIGYKRPSKAHQFPKGYSPNRNYRGRPKKQHGTISDEIEKAFATPLQVRLKPGCPPEIITAFELIVSRLYERAMKGDNASLKVLEKYEVYAASKPIIKIVADPPSREECANAYAASLEAERIAATNYDGPLEFTIDGITFGLDSSPREVLEAYYRWSDRKNKEYSKQHEKKVRRRKFV